MLKNFLGLFLMTFMICCFILLMQFVWMHVKDLVGKGVELSVLAEFFVYAVVTVVPLALPLAILLASLMTFGNLGEKFELTAMKSAGVSLFRIMRPLMISIAFISVGAFWFSNNVLPISQVKLWTLIFSLRQKSPEMEIPEGEFYDGINGYTVYVGKKNHKTGLLLDLMVYDYSEGFQNARVIVADSGRIYFTEDKKYLQFCLFSGESFENLDQSQQRATKSRDKIPYRRETFADKALLIDFSTDFERFDESILDDQHVSKNVVELVHSIDSVRVLEQERSAQQGEELCRQKYFGRERMPERSLERITGEETRLYNTYEMYDKMTNSEKARVLDVALEKAHSQRDQVEYNGLMLDEFKRYIRKHEVELHRKFTLAFACLIFFFIGAPLGAIIRKGGLGAPVVISVVIFIIYYIIDNTGYKLAREAIWPCWAGMWLSSFVILPVGIFLTWKAATDSALFNPDAWVRMANEFWKKISPKVLPVYEKYGQPIVESINKKYAYCKRSFRGFSRRKTGDSRG